MPSSVTKCSNRVVGRSKDGERTFTGEGINEPSCANCSFEQGVVLAVDDDVHHGGGLRGWWEQAQRR